MTIPSQLGINTALKALQAAQAAIDTTSQNIANVNNPAYSRQTADLTESSPISIPKMTTNASGVMQIGTGVDVTTISRIRDQFLDVQYRAQNSTTSGLNTSSGLLAQVQSALGEPSSNGVSSQLTAFWSSWSALAQAPTSPAAKQSVVDAGQTLATTFNAIESQLQTIQSQASQQYQTLTAANGPVQTDATQIAALNTEISQAQATGTNANGLLDQRDQLIDDLSSYGKVSVSDPSSNGLLVVNFGGDMTTPLVNGKTANSVSSLSLGPSSGGTLGALANLTSTSGPISGYLTTLNQWATSLASSVNSIHTATPFFNVATSTTALGATATTLSVPVTASTVQTTTTSNPGANDVALGIAGLAGGTADQNYGAFIAQVGSDVQSMQSSQKTGQALLTSIDNQRKSVSGVNLDEEMANLVRFQQAYQAAARTMTAVDSMLDTLINHTGVVGL